MYDAMFQGFQQFQSGAHLTYGRWLATAISGLFSIVLTSFMGCDSPPPRQWLMDSELLGSIDFNNPRPEHAPALVAVFDEHAFHICEAAMETLVKIGDPAIPALVDKLRLSVTLPEKAKPRRSQNWRAQRFVVRTFERIGPRAIPTLLQALNDQAFDHARIIVCLGYIYPTTPEAVSALSNALHGPFALTAAGALIKLGQAAGATSPELRAAVPALMAVPSHREARTRSFARAALSAIDSRTAREVGSDLPSFRDDSTLMRSIDFDRPRAEHATLLIQLFEDHSHQVYVRASEALIAMGHSAAEPLVEAMRLDMPLVTRVRAAAVLRRLGEAAVPAVAPALRDGRYDIPRLAYAVGTTRPLTSEVLGLLLGTVKQFENWEALLWLRWHGTEAREAIPALVSLLDHHNDRVRSASASALWNIDREVAQEAGIDVPWRAPKRR
jgi:HEAT repeat protein